MIPNYICDECHRCQFWQSDYTPTDRGTQYMQGCIEDKCIWEEKEDGDSG